MRKRIMILAAVLVCSAVLTGCKAAKNEQSKEVVVFAAASMTETLTEIGNRYEKLNPGVKLTFNFDSSGTLKTQIQEGAACDLFVSAGQKQMDQMDGKADAGRNPEGLDLVEEGTRRDLLENRVVLCAPEGNPAGVTDFDDLAERLADGTILLAVGNSDVPVGQYTQKVFACYGLKEEALAEKGVLTYGSNVKELTTQIAEGSVDCGVIYSTDAYSAGLTILDVADEEMCGRVIYPAAVIKTGKASKEAEKFLEYLNSPDAVSVFEAVGFQVQSK